MSAPLAPCPDPLQVIPLANGLTLIHHNFPVIPVTVVDVWVKAGAMSEPLSWSGVAHFLEHMIFKGTPTLQPGMFDQSIEQNGGMTNAATSHDYAHFDLTIASQYLPDTLPPLADLLLQAQTPATEIFPEREVVLDEIRSSYDDPDWLAFLQLCELLYPDHSYGRPVLGTAPDLERLTQKQLQCFHHSYYQPRNMTVVMVGDIRQETAIALTEKHFEQFPTACDCPAPPQQAVIVQPQVERRTIKIPNLAPSRLTLGWTGPGIDALADNIGLDILAVVLAGMQCSRLVQHLREELGLVFDIYSCFSLQQAASLFTLKAHLLPEAVDPVETEINKAITHLHQYCISPGELSRAQRFLCNDFIFSTEAPG